MGWYKLGVGKRGPKLKNNADAIIFQLAICDEASQICSDATPKIDTRLFGARFLRYASDWRIL